MAGFGVASNGGFQTYPNLDAPATIGASDTWSSAPIPLAGFNAFAFGAELSQTGTITIQRYIDRAATLPIGAAITQALVADTFASKNTNDGICAGSLIMSIENTGGVTADLSDAILLLCWFG